MELEEMIRIGRAEAVIESAKAISGKERVRFLRLAVRKIALGNWPSDFLGDLIKLGNAALLEDLALDEEELDR